jgi:hypothetical protein
MKEDDIVSAVALVVDDGTSSDPPDPPDLPDQQEQLPE